MRTTPQVGDVTSVNPLALYHDRTGCVKQTFKDRTGPRPRASDVRTAAAQKTLPALAPALATSALLPPKRPCRLTRRLKPATPASPRDATRTRRPSRVGTSGQASQPASQPAARAKPAARQVKQSQPPRSHGRAVKSSPAHQASGQRSSQLRVHGQTLRSSGPAVAGKTGQRPAGRRRQRSSRSRSHRRAGRQGQSASRSPPASQIGPAVKPSASAVTVARWGLPHTRPAIKASQQASAAPSGQPHKHTPAPSHKRGPCHKPATQTRGLVSFPAHCKHEQKPAPLTSNCQGEVKGAGVWAKAPYYIPPFRRSLFIPKGVIHFAAVA